MLVVRNGFESGTNGYLRFPEAYISANQSVHRTVVLHIGFDIGCCFHLVRGIFVDKAGFQFVLHETVWAVSETFFLFSFGVEENQIAGDIFYF